MEIGKEGVPPDASVKGYTAKEQRILEEALWKLL